MQIFCKKNGNNTIIAFVVSKKNGSNHCCFRSLMILKHVPFLLDINVLCRGM